MTKAALLASSVALAGVVWSAHVGAQQQKPPTFRLGINLTQIDVTVLGPDGKPARGLTREDFTLFEDGEKQDLLGFAEIHIPDGGDGPAWLRDAAPDVRTAGDGRVLLFMLDDAMTNDDLQSRQRVEVVKRISFEVIDRMGPTDVAAVLCTFDNRCAQDFTNDRALLKAAVSRFTPKRFPVGGGYHWDRPSVGIARSVSKYLIEQPGRRKAVIWVSPLMPRRPLNFPHVAAGEDPVQAANIIRLFEDALRSKITIYGINSSGLLSLTDEDEDPVVALGGESRNAPRFAAPPRSVAAETGGFVIRTPEQFTEGVAQIFRETGSYYLLGYEQPPKKDTGFNMVSGFRSLKVEVNRPGYTVRSREGYLSPKPVTSPKNPPPAGSDALAGILPKTDVPLRVAVAPFAVPGRPEAAVAITLAVGEPAPAQRTLERVKLQFRAFTMRGEARGIKHDAVDITIPAGREGDIYFEVLAELRLKPGVYALRFSAESERLGKAGAVYADIEIPDFAKAPLSMSGVLLSAQPRLPVAQANALAALVPVVPTTLREFEAGHVAEAFVRVYQGGKNAVAPVAVAATVLNERSEAVVRDVTSLDAGRFGPSRAADYRYLLPIDKLAPGLYLLRIETTTGAVSARRDVRFIVR